MIGNQAQTDLLASVTDWRDELQAKLGDARHTVRPRAFKLLAAEVKTFKRVCAALAYTLTDGANIEQ